MPAKNCGGSNYPKTFKVWRDRKNQLLFFGDEQEILLVKNFSFKDLCDIFPEISVDEIKTIIENYEKKHARNYSVRLLERYPQTRYSLRDKLIRHGYGSDVANCIVDWAHTMGYINELAIADSLLRKTFRQGFSLQWFRQKAKVMGIPESIISEISAEKNESLQSQSDRILELAKRILKKIPKAKDRRRILASRLSLRGYSSEEIFKVFQYLNFSCVDIDNE